MPGIESINSERILWCCQDRGITPRELAESLKFSWDRFQQVLSEGDGLSFNQLRKIADYFNRGVLFFLEADPVDITQVHTPQFRTIANQKPTISAKVRALIERVEHHRDIYVSLQEQLQGKDAARFEPPRLPRDNVKRAAEITRRWLDLDENKNTFSSYRSAIEARNVLVFRSQGYNGSWQIPKDDPICGFTVYSADHPVIVVRKMPSESRQSFTLMHELGHVLLHKKSFIDDEDDLLSHAGKEKVANAFAGNLLVPDSFLQQIDHSGQPNEVGAFDDWLRPYRESWGVSTEVILRRLLDARRLSEVNYRRYREWRKAQPLPPVDQPARKYRHREPNHIFGKPFVTTVLDAFHAKKISLARASTYLDNLKVADVHKLEATYDGI